MCGAQNTFSTGPEDVPSVKYSGLWDTMCVRRVCVCFYAVSVSVTCIRRCLRGPGGPFQLLRPARSLEPGPDGARAVGTDPPRPWSLGLTGRVSAVRGRRSVKRLVAHRVESRRLRLGGLTGSGFSAMSEAWTKMLFHFGVQFCFLLTIIQPTAGSKLMGSNWQGFIFSIPEPFKYLVISIIKSRRGPYTL